jgi:hypothetical protein
MLNWTDVHIPRTANPVRFWILGGFDWRPLFSRISRTAHGRWSAPRFPRKK